MPETFSPITWSDGTGGGTPITAAQLNRIEVGVESMDDRVTAVEDGKVASTLVDAKGDLIVATANDTVARLAVGGTNGQILKVNSGASTGLVYGTDTPPVHVVGNSGSAITFDASAAAGPIKTVTLNANCTVTLTGATSGLATGIELVIKQDATGNRVVTWPGSVKWSGGPPLLSVAANATDRVGLITYDGGTTWFGTFIGKGYA